MVMMVCRQAKAAVADVTARRLDVLLYKRLAARKLASFRAFAELYPEYCWVFAGDNGQVLLLCYTAACAAEAVHGLCCMATPAGRGVCVVSPWLP